MSNLLQGVAAAILVISAAAGLCVGIVTFAQRQLRSPTLSGSIGPASLPNVLENLDADDQADISRFLATPLSDMKSVAAEVDRLFREHPDDPSVNYVRGVVLLFDEPAEAVRSLKFAAESADPKPSYVRMYAISLLYTGDQVQIRVALDLLGTLVSTHPTYAHGFEGLARAEYAAGDTSSALKYVKEAQRLGDSSALVWFWRGIYEYALGDYPSAVGSFKLAEIDTSGLGPNAIHRLYYDAGRAAYNISDVDSAGHFLALFVHYDGCTQANDGECLDARYKRWTLLFDDRRFVEGAGDLNDWLAAYPDAGWADAESAYLSSIATSAAEAGDCAGAAAIVLAVVDHQSGMPRASTVDLAHALSATCSGDDNGVARQLASLN